LAATVTCPPEQAVSRMHPLRVEVIRSAGDNGRTAGAMAKQVEIDRVIAEVLADRNSAQIQQVQPREQKAAMVGDGINDAPALAIADIGMAVGTGPDIAIEAADITLMRGDLNSVADAVMMSQKTIRNIKENLFFAFIYNTIGIPIAALGFLAPW